MFQHAPLAGDTLWDKAHSTYLALWFELGIIAGTFPMLVVAGLLFRAILGLWDTSSRMISAAAIAVIAVFSIHSVVDFSAEIMADAFLFTAILALGAAGGRHGEL
jgi:O-antigen ligase